MTPPAEVPVRPHVTREAIIAVIALAAIAAYLVARWVGFDRADWPLYAALVVGGAPLVRDLALQAFRREFGADLLAGLSIIVALILREPLAGVIVVLMLSGGEVLEQMAIGRASSVLDALARRSPSTAWRVEADEVAVEVPVSDVGVGDTLQIPPHGLCPVDGVVLDGHGSMDEAFLTGEPYQVRKAPGVAVISGAVNGDTTLTVRATAVAADSRYAKIVGVVHEAERNRPPIRRLADRLGALYTPLAVAVAVAAWALSGDPVRMLAVLVVATPCPLLIAIPVALIGGISLAAKRGIIVRDPAILEQIDRCTTVILDKTGTLTTGEPRLTDIVTAAGVDADSVLTLAASAEVYSKHPLGRAILGAARDRGLAMQTADHLEERPGEGMRATFAGIELRIVGRKHVAGTGIEAALPPEEPGLESIVLLDGALAATLRFRDEARPDSARFVGHLGPKHALSRVLIVSGDRRAEVEHLAAQVGVTELYAGQSPEQKVAIVRRERALGPTLFVGDGINDAPALRAATVGVAVGKVHEVTSEAAGAVILDPSLRKLDELLHIGARFRRIALQSAVGGMLASGIAMGFAAAGLLAPVAGALVQEAIDLAAVLNALRVARTTKQLTDFEGSKRR